MTDRPPFSPFWVGVAVGAIYAALMLVTVLLQPLVRATNGPVLPAPALVTAYVVGGVVMGGVLHVLWPRVGSLAEAIACGMAAAMPFFFAVRLAVLAFGGWDPPHVAGLALRIAAGGALAGFTLWHVQQGRTRPM